MYMYNLIKRLRERAGVTQARLAALGGTSQPAIAAYEAGRRSPNLDTVARLAGGVGLELAIDFVPPSTREDRRSLLLHYAVARRLEEEPGAVLARARANLALMVRLHPHASRTLAEWERLLHRPVQELAALLRDPRPFARELRQTSPFAGVLSAPERAALYREFRANERSA
ncbi:MAG: helix-turn-helix transcriptional regulator [Gemmatimonadota bacterium]|nr:helix-turn-helix transcriptional regulator [Gemmatimonadota bacterium]